MAIGRTEDEDVYTSIVEFCGVENIKEKFPAYKQGNDLENLLGKFERLFFLEYIETSRDWNLEFSY